MYSLLFHKDVWLHKDFQETVLRYQKEFFNSYFYSKHFEDRLNNSSDRSHDYLKTAVESCLKTIKDNPQEAFEIEMSKDYHFFKLGGWFVTKYCIRIPYSAEQDLCVAIRPQYKNSVPVDNMIVTAWLNNKKDSHNTLDKTKYCTEEKFKNS